MVAFLSRAPALLDVGLEPRAPLGVEVVEGEGAEELGVAEAAVADAGVDPSLVVRACAYIQ